MPTLELHPSSLFALFYPSLSAISLSISSRLHSQLVNVVLLDAYLVQAIFRFLNIPILRQPSCILQSDARLEG